MFVEHLHIRDDVSKNLESASARARENGNHELAVALADVQRTLCENQFTLAVLGEFKRGKSTLINALLGRPLLPSAVVPLTSVITVVEYGEALQVRVRFQGGVDETIPLETVPAYVTERENPRNEKGVADVLIAYPAPFLKGGVRLVDTPGVGSVYEHNTQVALEFLPRADAALFVVSADQPVSAAEVAFLRQLRPYVEKLFFLLNKTDLLAEDEQREALAFVRQTLCDALGAPSIRLFAVSARRGLEGKIRPDPATLSQSRLAEFEKELEAFLLEEKGTILLLSTMNRATRLLERERFALELREGILKMPLGVLPERQAAFERQKEGILKKRGEARYLLQQEIAGLIARLDQHLGEFRRDCTPRLLARLAEAVAAGPRRTRALRAMLNDRIDEAIRSAFTPWLVEEEKTLAREVAAVTRTFAERINAVVERLMELSAGLYGVAFQPIEPTEGLRLASGFSYYDVRLMEPSFLKPMLDLAIDLLPRGLSCRLVVQDARRMLLEQIERHCGRVREDCLNRLQRELQEFQSALDGWVDQTVARIEDAISAARDQKSRTEAQLNAEIHRLQQEIGAMDRSLSHLQQLRREIESSG